MEGDKEAGRKMKITTLDIEIAVAQFLDLRANLIVPNVSWGMELHECDLLIATKNRYLWEIEIKISKADLVKDKGKRHGHYDERIKRLYFAIPDTLIGHIDHVPDRAGIIVVDTEQLLDYRSNNRNVKMYRYCCDTIKEPQQASGKKMTDAEYLKLARLGAMRVWALKNKIQKLKEG